MNVPAAKKIRSPPLNNANVRRPATSPLIASSCGESSEFEGSGSGAGGAGESFNPDTSSTAHRGEPERSTQGGSE